METGVPQCSQCQGNVEFYCRTCKRNLCVFCKEDHVLDLDTKYHNVVIDRFKDVDHIIYELGNCERHRDQTLNKCCLSCERFICASCCDDHQNHDILDRVSFKIMFRQLHIERLVQIRTETIPNNRVILENIKSEVETGVQFELSDLQQSMMKRAWRLKNLVDVVLNDINELKRSMRSRFQEPKKNIIKTETFMYKLGQLSDKPVQFFLYLKKTPIPKVNDFPDAFKFSLKSEINMGEIIKLLLEIQIIETKERQVSNEQLLEMMPKPVLKNSFSVVYVSEVRHISCVTTDMVWVSDPRGFIILTNTRGVPSCFLLDNMDTVNDTGGHCVTREGNLVFIDKHHNISKLSTNKIRKNTLIKVRNPWVAKCVYSSSSNGDLLVGILRSEKEKNKPTKAKVVRYNSEGKPIQVIGDENTDQRLFEHPLYITENHNGDVIVSDQNRAVVVTDRGGKHRFSYTGPPPEEQDEFSFTGPLSRSRLLPLGICVDALSNILVSDANSKTIQMIDKDGHFLSVLFSEQRWKKAPRALGYNNKNHLLWVGTSDHKEEISIYRYIQRKNMKKVDEHY
ncbi:uncharacterized protein LOC134263250 [Saccostrea cucullata]|uniref:uncharacterized protein LOC134263250 n=1 Tax=Saccostrea cuccullata TaxID=36930 RepID=UPI002ED635AE